MMNELEINEFLVEYARHGIYNFIVRNQTRSDIITILLKEKQGISMKECIIKIKKEGNNISASGLWNHIKDLEERKFVYSKIRKTRDSRELSVILTKFSKIYFKEMELPKWLEQ